MTLFVICYDLVAPKKAELFYHVYGEIVLELFLIIFWVTSFAGMASYVSQVSPLNDILRTDTSAEINGLTSKSKASEICCKVIAILGALILYVTHLSYSS